MELRYPRPPSDTPRQGAAGQIRGLPPEELLDSLSVRLNGEKTGATALSVNVRFSDADAAFLLTVENAVLHHREGRSDPAARP